MYSMALRIQGPNNNEDPSPFFQGLDSVNNVEGAFQQDRVFVSDRVMAARPRPNEWTTDHAEARVANLLCSWYNQNQLNRDWILFYVKASPCATKCADPKHPGNILGEIAKLKKWSRFAFVFSDVFQPNPNNQNAQGKVFQFTEEDQKNALKQVAKRIGRRNIFRCNNNTCVKCFNKNGIDTFCISG